MGFLFHRALAGTLMASRGLWASGLLWAPLCTQSVDFLKGWGLGPKKEHSSTQEIEATQ